MSSHTTIDGIDCYGIMDETQNIYVKCDDESDDGVLPMGFDSWKDAVEYIKTKWSGDPVELEAI